MTRRIDAVLFDLDGTLIDSAPDLAGACNDMRTQRGLAALPYAQLRAMVGSGARGMVGTGFGIGPDDDAYAALRDEFLNRYESRMTRETRVFAGVPSMLARLRESGRCWGIVTNKASRFATPLVASLGFAEQAAALICGDTTAHAKPHPEPLLEAARRMGVDPVSCVYVGDDRRDIEAGRAAGMRTLAAAWGYLGAGGPMSDWGATDIVETVGDIPDWIERVT